MFSHLLSSALEKLTVKDSSSFGSSKSLYPTLSFPPSPPAGTGTDSLCARCLTLLSHVVIQFGDGTGYSSLKLPHSSFIPEALAARPSNASRLERDETPISTHSNVNAASCVLCAKTAILFDAARAHVSFEASLRNTPRKEWKVTWNVDAPDSKIYPQFAFPHGSVSVLITVGHKGGYGWGIGGFKIYPDPSAGIPQKVKLGDNTAIVALDDPGTRAGRGNSAQIGLDFSSTLGPGTLTLISSWARECAASHAKCQRIFGSNGLAQPVTAWFPDRLIKVDRSESAGNGQATIELTARVVLKSSTVDFPPETVAKGINYISLSHSWGLAPDPSAPLGGRAGTVLTASNIAAWREDVPLDDLPLTFRHAVLVCASLGFEYIWIDSLCILQDSREDWQTQSAVMGDVYKFAWLNVAAMSSTSDYEGFINDARDPRCEFGFNVPFASVLGRSAQERNSTGKECVLLQGQALFLWNYAADIPGSNSSNAPLFKRAWVFQERSLARRTLGFTSNTVYWACDEYSRGERPDWAHGGLAAQGLRDTLHGVIDTLSEAARSTTTTGDASPSQPKISPAQARGLISSFDQRWFLSVTSYTFCNLTKHTDKLIAVSSVARELANTRILGKRYLAGLWDINLPFQLAWLNVNGRRTPRRKRVGQDGFVAPSWSWASVEAPVQPRFIFNSANDTVALADVLAADVALETQFAFGSVTAGWLRMRGRLNRVTAANTAPFYVWDKDSKSTSLTDAATGETLWLSADTVEGYETVASRTGIQDVVWAPLTLRFGHRTLDCTCLVLVEVRDSVTGVPDGFLRDGEKVYRRLGSGNFGRVPSMLGQDRLLLELGAYPNVQVKDEQGLELVRGFKRREEDMVEFVLI